MLCIFDFEAERALSSCKQSFQGTFDKQLCFQSWNVASCVSLVGVEVRFLVNNGGIKMTFSVSVSAFQCLFRDQS